MLDGVHIVFQPKENGAYITWDFDRGETIIFCQYETPIGKIVETLQKRPNPTLGNIKNEKEDCRLARKQYWPGDRLEDIRHFMKVHRESVVFGAMLAYSLGKMDGKRAERARKKTRDARQGKHGPKSKL